jgi:PAS domain S-box-containing protein
MKTQTRQPMRARSLTATLGIAFLALSVVVLLISSILQIFSNLQTQQAAIANQQQFIAQDAARVVSNDIQEKFSVLETAVRLANPATVPQEGQRRILAGLLGLQPAFRQLVVLNTQDQESAQISRLGQSASRRLTDQISRDLLTQSRQGKKYIGPVYVDPVTMEPLVVIAVPATDALGDFQGTLVAEVNLKFMWNLVDQLKVGKTGWAYVVNGQGNLIAFGDTARVLQGENVQNLEKVSEFMSSSAPADAMPANLITGIKGTTVVGTYVPLGTPDWAVVTELPWQEAYRQVIQVAVVSLGVTLVVVVLAGLVGTFLARRLAVPLVNLTETATRIADGETGLQAAVGGPSEVARLATAFNSMTAQLRQSLESLEQQVVEVKQAEESLRRANEALQALIDYSPLAIMTLDLDGHILLWNNAAEEMYGWTAQQVLGEFPPFLPEDKRQEQLALRERVNREGILTDVESEGRRKDGSRILNGVSIAPLRDSTGSVYALMSIATDITERKRVEEAVREEQPCLSRAPRTARCYMRTRRWPRSAVLTWTSS